MINRRMLMINMWNFIPRCSFSSAMHKRGPYKKKTLETETVAKVAEVVVQHLQHKVEDTSVLFVINKSWWLDMFAAYNFRKVWVTVHTRLDDPHKLDDPKYERITATPYKLSRAQYLKKLNGALKNHPFFEGTSEWEKEEARLCVVAASVKPLQLMAHLETMLCEPSVFFPCGRVPHFMLVSKKMAKRLTNTGGDSLTCFHQNIFDIQVILECPNGTRLLKIVPHSNLYTEVVEEPSDIQVLCSLVRGLKRADDKRLIPHMETYFPGVGLTLLEAGFHMSTGVDDLDFSKLYLFLKLLKTCPSYTSAWWQTYQDPPHHVHLKWGQFRSAKL